MSMNHLTTLPHSRTLVHALQHWRMVLVWASSNWMGHTFVQQQSICLMAYFMFPTGLIFLHIHTLVVLFGLFLLILRKWFSIPFYAFSLFGLFSDWKPPRLQKPSTENMVSIMTWNIQGLDTLTNPNKPVPSIFYNHGSNKKE